MYIKWSLWCYNCDININTNTNANDTLTVQESSQQKQSVHAQATITEMMRVDSNLQGEIESDNDDDQMDDMIIIKHEQQTAKMVQLMWTKVTH